MNSLKTQSLISPPTHWKSKKGHLEAMLQEQELKCNIISIAQKDY